MKSEFVLCVDDREAPDLERRKFYRVLRDVAARKHRMLRVIDESGDDYLYPEAYFVEVPLPAAVASRLKGRARSPKRPHS